MLYAASAAGKAFHDVVSGDNRCTRQDGGCCKFGFESAAGWDAVFGLGTPVFEALKAYVLALP